MIKWTITSLESQPNTGIVVSAKWLCSGIQDGFVASMSGISAFPEPESDYISYVDLTETQVLGWVWNVGGVDQNATEASVNNALQEQINPLVVQLPVPWPTVAEVTNAP